MSQGELPGRHESLWTDTTPRTDFPALDGDLRVDTAVVGGGIVGVTAALDCAEAGREVALLEADRVVEGVTGKTTAKITAQHGLVYDELLRKHGRERARGYAEANSAAVETVARRVEEYDIDCDFERLPAYTYAADEDQRRAIKRETAAAEALDLPASYVEDPPFPAESPCAVRFDDQAQFHPRKYLLDLVEAIPEAGSHVFEETRVTGVEDGDSGVRGSESPCEVETERGTVTAENVLVATHFPIEDPAFYFARQHPKRSYVLAVRLAEEPPRGMFYRDAEPYFSVRPHPTDDGTLTLVGGQNHKTGQGGSTAERYRKLESQARERFDVESVEYRWSTQDYVSADKVPFVGRLGPGYENVYGATGFGGWGMTNGTAAGTLLAALARGGSTPWAETFDPERLDPGASGKDLVAENVDAGAQFARDWGAAALAGGDAGDLAPGEGKVVRRGGKPLAVSRDDEGEIHAVSAVCTHMKCLVRWNDGEESWDCPCHGSRFSVDGEVLDGPAVEDLSKRGE
ncbi:FAD-dependent oxidoreductase [Halorussus salilacus]|uniref:FAD-dependent oxidoreductase n=1 Tax=Halorussus salilacus TaxID=2953750 RepID=UPI00209F9957|nr:FAD-dependent oxidoreductase [Halorussus salilacus]USZ68589.1 FAD-dependent oxidoreductase [Halorussus salilacus]